MAGNTLVIVESPAKARKISGYLGPDFTVMASLGHIRDLAAKASQLPDGVRKEKWAKLAVDVDAGFTPYYVNHDSKASTIKEMKAALKEADFLLLATDEDREGEAIAWHLLEVLKPKVPVKRMVFNEITPEAIRAAVEDPRDLDMRMVDAQETRRVVDRLYGYPVSEVLWKKVGRDAKSAGRVQSVAVRLVVDRERERIAHVSAEYWDLAGDFLPGPFRAELVALNGARLAGSKDFTELGQLKSESVERLDEARATALVAALTGAEFTVGSVAQKPGTAKPKAPFMTSTLQQEAYARFRWGAQRTMRVAQSLYENGFITYMRTDSANLSEQALNAARAQARELFGAEYVPDAPRTYPSKVKNAQEAHEAIRPAGESFRTPGEVSGELRGDDFMLYDLIWRRTLACQMVDAKVATTTVRLNAKASTGEQVEFSASGTVTVFPGFRAALEDVEDIEDKNRQRELPALVEGQSVTAEQLEAVPHRTSPPARFTEASLVARLEELGIGRPSTYASIMSTILDRGYVWKKGSALVPSFTAFSVVRLLEEHFTALVDYDFTRDLEDVLDLIATGEADRVQQLEAFWRGGHSVSGDFPGIKRLTEDLGAIDAREIATSPIAGTDAVLRVGRYGAYVERGEERANIPVGLAPDELTAEKAEELLAMPSGDRELGTDPQTGLEILAKTGRYGPYVTEVLPEGSPKSAKPRTASLFSDMSLDTVTLEDALRLLSLPRVVGTDPADGVDITAQNGPYGPYLKKLDKDTRQLGSEAEIFTVTLEQALALFAQPKQRRGRAAPKPPLREVGNDPTTGLAIVVREGNWGPYVTDGETNASLRSADDPATISVERASDLLAERRAAGPSVKKSARKAPARGGKSAKPSPMTAKVRKAAARKKPAAAGSR